MDAHGFGVVEVGGDQAFESWFARCTEVVGDKCAAVVGSPLVSASEFLILVDGIDEFRMEGECGFGGGRWIEGESFEMVDDGDMTCYGNRRYCGKKN